MMVVRWYKKGLVLGIIVLFIGGCLVPGISSKTNNTDNDKSLIDESSTVDDDLATLTFNTFNEKGKKENKIILPINRAKYIFNHFEDLKNKTISSPNSQETWDLKNEFIELLDANNLIPRDMSKTDIQSLINPHGNPKNQNIRSKTTYLGMVFDLLFNSRFNLLRFLNGLGSDSDWNIVCNIAGGGTGIPLPLFILPRPRLIALWGASAAVTITGSLLIVKSFIATGGQQGVALGFVGVGLTIAFAGFMAYGMLGYAIYTIIRAAFINRYNMAPVISDESPPHGSVNVPIDLDKLSFRLTDDDRDLMSYTVTTSPDIGSDSGSNKGNGVYHVPVSGLESDTDYTWHVTVDDGYDTVEEQFSFSTVAGPPFNPFEEGWQYRKKITIDHTQVTGDLTSFPVLISTVDVDLRDKAQNDGDDILFMDGPGVANKLYHEIEYFSGSSGELVAWVNIPSLSSGVDTVFYMYYGNTLSGNQQYPEKVWDSDYIAVYHMHDSSGYIQDSTAYNNNAVGIYGNPSYHQTLDVGYSIGFDGDTCFELPSYGLNGNNFEMTTTVLAKWDSCVQGDYHIVLQLEKEVKTSPLKYWGDKDIVCALVSRPEPNLFPYYTIGTADTTRSHLYQMHVKEEDEVATWKDGTTQKDQKTMTQIETIELRGNTLGSMRMDDPYYDRFFDGTIDEVRISKVKRSDNWIRTTYETICNPFSFFSVGPEESAP